MTNDPSVRLSALRPAPEFSTHDREAMLDVIINADRSRAGTSAASTATSSPHRRPPASGRRRRLAVLAIAAVAALAVPLLVTAIGPTSSRPTAYAAAAVHFAEHSPRLLVGAVGWRVADLNQYDTDDGQMSFTSNSQNLAVDWQQPADSFEPVSQEVLRPRPITVDNHSGFVGAVNGPGSSGYFEARWTTHGFGVRVIGRAATLGAFVAPVLTMHEVTVTELLAALPKDVVTPAGRRATTRGMLADVPRPPGYDPAGTTDSALLLDRYQLGARLVLKVSCGWLHEWLHGSPADRNRAAAAMASSHKWAILQEMKRQGDFPLDIWLGADVMNGASLGNYRTPGVSKASQLLNWLCG